MPDSIVGKEFLPNVHIEKITYQEIENRTSVQVEIAIYDYKERTWSMDNRFTGYLSIDLVYLAKKDHIELVKQGETTLRGMFPLQTGNGALIVVPYSNLVMLDANIDNTNYKKFKKVVSIPMPRNYENLSFFANTSMDVQGLKDNEGLNLEYSENNYSGPIAGEDIIRENERVETSSVFTDENGAYWAGPVHQHPEKGYMEGSKHRSVPHKNLTLDTEVPNSKLQFLSPVVYASYEPESSRQVVALGGMQKPARLQKTPIYQQDFVQDTSGNISGTFIADLCTLSLSESRVATIIYNYNRAVFNSIASNLNIENIKINRYDMNIDTYTNQFNLKVNKIQLSKPTLIVESFNNKRKVKEKVLYKISPTEKLSVEPKNIKESSKKKVFDGTEVTKDIIQQGQKIGAIKQINLTLPKNLRAISFTDYEVKSIRGMEFGFSVDIQIKDEFLTYVKQILKDITSFSRKLESFQGLLLAKNAFDGNKFKLTFLQEYYSQYGIEISESTGTISSDIDMAKLKNIFIFEAFDRLREAEQISGLKSRAASLLPSFNLFSTDPDKMDKAIKYYNKVVSHFKKTYSINIEKNYDKSLTKSPRKDRPIIKKTITMPQTYKKPLIPKIGFNYISEEKTEGPKVINLNMFKKRAENETKKFFKSMPTVSTPNLKDLSEDDKKTFVNLSENMFKHFSPSRVFFGNKEIATTTLNPEGMNVEFFNDLKITREIASMAQEENHNPEDKEEQESFFTDSRNYLGEDTKFSSTLLATLRRNPNKLSKIRKTTRLLDRKILVRKKPSISLDSFDLASKNNIISKSFAKDMKQVPIQIKALSLLKTNTTNFDVGVLDFDPLANPQTDEAMKQNFLNIGKVEYLEGFEISDGIPMLNKPIFREITPKAFEELKSKNVLCQIKNTNFDSLTVDDTQNFQIFDKVFTLESSNEDQMDIGETQQLSRDSSDMPDIFIQSVLNPIFYSSTKDSSSVVDPLMIDGPVVLDRTAPIQPGIQLTPNTRIGGGY